MGGLGLVHHPIYQEHDAGPYHPESPARLAALEEMLSGPGQDLFTEIAPRPASREEIIAVHTPAHFDRVAATSGREYARLDPDTATSPKSFEAALWAAGGLLALTEAVHGGRIDSGLALVRPPGHHAEPGRAMGFCLFNNIAVAARYALDKLGYERILIVDWDLHHGNGTQHAFEDTDEVLYFSSHQYPYYPGTGNVREVGRGSGLGFTLNVPLSPGHDDADYVQIYTRLLSPVARKYRPEMILVSAGFDIHFQDPLGAQAVTEKGFAALARLLAELTAELCPGRLVLTLEGGYHIQGQTKSVLAMMAQLAGRPAISPGQLRDDPNRPDIPAVAAARRVFSHYWPNLKEQ